MIISDLVTTKEVRLESADTEEWCSRIDGALTSVYTKGHMRFSGIAIGGIVGLDIFFLSFISGASMNHI